jgi:serine/threonine-protein kinase RsbW
MSNPVPHLHLAFCNDDARIGQVATMVREFLAQLPFSMVARTQIELALVEALNNIHLHGAEGLESVEITVDLSLEGSELQVTIRDNGHPVPELGRVEMPDPRQENSRGLPLIHACVDHVDYQSQAGWNRLLFIRRLAESDATDEPPAPLKISGGL